jgi:hypothetical protein
MSKYPSCPTVIKGSLEISKGRNGVFIGGDTEGLRSLAKLLTWLADVDQEQHPTMPDGEREHTHLDRTLHLTQFSATTELCRLDAKGTGDFPDRYAKKHPAKVRKKGRSKS